MAPRTRSQGGVKEEMEDELLQGKKPRKSIDEENQKPKHRKSFSHGHGHTGFAQLIPSLPNEVVKSEILVRVPRGARASLPYVSKAWHSFVTSREYVELRRARNLAQHWLYMVTQSAEDEKLLMFAIDTSRMFAVMEIPSSDDDTQRLLRHYKSWVVSSDGTLFCLLTRGNKLQIPEIWSFDPRSNRWFLLENQSLQVPRLSPIGVPLYGEMYIFDRRKKSFLVEVFDPLTYECRVIGKSTEMMDFEHVDDVRVMNNQPVFLMRQQDSNPEPINSTTLFQELKPESLSRYNENITVVNDFMFMLRYKDTNPAAIWGYDSTKAEWFPLQLVCGNELSFTPPPNDPTFSPFLISDLGGKLAVFSGMHRTSEWWLATIDVKLEGQVFQGRIDSFCTGSTPNLFPAWIKKSVSVTVA